MNLEITISDNYYNLVPRPTLEERKALKESIIIHGQREPIIINENGVILDGHTRFEICSDLGLEPKYRIEKFETETLEIGYVIEANLKRRHLTSFQKIELSYVLYLAMKEDAIERGRSNLKSYSGKLTKNNIVGRTTDNLGREIGVGRNALQMGLYIIKNGDDKLKKSLRNGSVSITMAYKSLQGIKRKQSDFTYIRSSQDVRCPCCKSVFKKKELQIV